MACTAAGEEGNGKPLVTAITKDGSTRLYSFPVIKNGSPLVLDLSGPIIWSTCPDSSAHDTIDCNSPACMRAHRYHPPNCPHTGYGQPDAPRNPYRCKCTAHPHNPLGSNSGGSTPQSGQDLTRVALSANATDGNNPLSPPVAFTAVASCAPESLLEGLPEGSVGVAGLGRSALSLPAQVGKAQGVCNKFALCLPSGSASGNLGVAIFGGGPLSLLPMVGTDLTASLAGETPLVKYKECPGYYVKATAGIAVNQAQVVLPLDDGKDGCGPLVVGFSTTAPYTELRSDVYRAFIKAFDAATSGIPRLPSPTSGPKFELCYESAKLGSTRLGYAVPQVDVMLDGGKNWTVFGGNSMAQVDDRTACLAFVEMAEGKATYGGGGEAAAPAVVIGGFQMENNLVVFDEEEQRLGFSGLLWGRRTTCSNFNFTMAAV